LETTDPYEGTKLNLDNEYVAKTEELLTQSFGVAPLLKYSGGGLPIVTHFEKILGVPQVLTPLANEDCNMHGANENFNIEILEKALKFSQSFFTK
jgi:acetylornithine deacetylase/succinyl-diaminopimelate desuccinylase-like protein